MNYTDWAEARMEQRGGKEDYLEAMRRGSRNMDKVHNMDAAAITAFGQYIVMPVAVAAIFVAMLYFGTKK